MPIWVVTLGLRNIRLFPGASAWLYFPENFHKNDSIGQSVYDVIQNQHITSQLCDFISK